jgi:hypothetical protein
MSNLFAHDVIITTNLFATSVAFKYELSHTVMSYLQLVLQSVSTSPGSNGLINF